MAFCIFCHFTIVALATDLISMVYVVQRIPRNLDNQYGIALVFSSDLRVWQGGLLSSEFGHKLTLVSIPSLVYVYTPGRLDFCFYVIVYVPLTICSQTVSGKDYSLCYVYSSKLTVLFEHCIQQATRLTVTFSSAFNKQFVNCNYLQ